MLKYIGSPHPMDDAIAKVTGQATYCDDMFLPKMLVGKVLYSPYAHAMLKDIDTSEAEALPGVRAVITYKNSPDVVVNRKYRGMYDNSPATDGVFNRHIRWAGDPIAAVAADTEEIAAKALRLIKPDFEVLPNLFDVRDALKPDAPQLYEGGNLLKHIKKDCGDVDKAFEAADVCVSQKLFTKMIHHGMLETHVCIATWQKDGEINIYAPQQGVFRTQMTIARVLNVPLSTIHYHGTVMGGAFGGKDGIMGEVYACLLSKMTARPVKIRYSRKETMAFTFTRHASEMNTRLALTKDGLITGLDFDIQMNAGAHCGNSIGILAAMCTKMFKVYAIPNMRFDGNAIFTNLLNGGPMRGFGSPKVFTAIEVLMDKAAKTIGMDPVEFRLKNAVKPYDIDPESGDSLGNARTWDTIDRGRRLFDWDEKKKTVYKNNTQRYRYGIGCACAMHGNGVSPVTADITVSTISMLEDGCAMLRTSVADHGAGTYTLMKLIVAEILQMEPEKVHLVHSDTEYGEYDMAAGASRNTWSGGQSVVETSVLMRERLKSIAAEMMGVEVEEVDLTGGVFHTKDRLKRESRYDVIRYAMEVKNTKLIVSHSYNSDHNAGSYGTHFALVRVDTETGETNVLDYAAECDVGTVLNPMLLEGQVEGAVGIGMGMALFEELELDANGMPKNANFRKYRMARASDMPKMKVEFVAEYEPGGPFGGKSIGEASIVPVAPAIINAVNDALGTELTDLPLTPAKILAALGK